MIDLELAAALLAIIATIVGGLWKVFKTLDSIQDDIIRVNNNVNLQVNRIGSALKLVDYRLGNIESFLKSGDQCIRPYRGRTPDSPPGRSGAKFLDDMTGEDDE